MITTILNSEDKQFIFEFSFSPNQPISSDNASLTPGEMEDMNEEDTDVDTELTTVVGTAPLTYLDLVVYREDLPDLKFEWSGNMKQNIPIPLQVPEPPPPATAVETKKTTTVKKIAPVQAEPDDNCCKGEFHLYQNSYTGQKYVWFDLQFGSGYEAAYEGCMVQFPVTT